MAIDFKNMNVSKPTVLGTTTINHAARIELGLNCSEYALMDYIYRCVKNKRKMDIVEVYRQTGFTEDEQRRLLPRLIQKGFVMPEMTDPPTITDKWQSAFSDIEAEFDEYMWKKDGKVFFPGNKKKARSYYVKLRKKYSREFLQSQRDQYARLLMLERTVNKFNRNVMIGERFLGPNEDFMQDWKGAADAIDPKLKKEQESTKRHVITEEERRLAYEQDSNQ